MKSVITAIFLFILLIIIFAIIDHNHTFHPGDAVAFQEENTTFATSSYPVEKPTEPKTMETNSVSTITPEKHISAAESDFTAKNNPAAVPFATPEEAKILNEEAIEYALAKKEKKEPFYRLYKDIELETVSFQGTIRAVSDIPDPTKNDYPNCLYTVFVELDSILSDTPLSEKIPYEVIVDIPIMKDRTVKDDNIFQPDDQIICNCASYDAMPQSIQEIQLSDDIQSFEHQQYYALDIKKVSNFSANGKKPFAKREITILPIQSFPKDEKATELRQKRIQSEIEHIEDELKKHGGSFSAWKEEYKEIAERYKKLCDEGYKGWINDSYFSASGKESTYDTNAYIEWILPYKKYLEMNNIDLIVLRFPSRSDFAARVLASNEFEENPAWIEHYYNCLKSDIEIVDTMPAMWENRFDYPLFYFYGSRSDFHPFEGELKIAAEVVSSVLKERYDYVHDPSFSLKKQSINSSLYYYPEGHYSFSSNQPIEFDGLCHNNKTVGYLSATSGSPFLFLSSSVFGYRAMQARGASVPHYSSYYLQTQVDWKYQSGIRNPMIRNLIAAPTLLNKRRAVIMVGWFDSWTSGPKIPNYYFEDIKTIIFEKKYDFLSQDIAITEINSCITTNHNDGTLSVSGDPTSNKKSSSIRIHVPISCPTDRKYKTSMIRVIFKNKSNHQIMLNAYVKKDKKDSAVLPNISIDSSDLRADLFVPLDKDISSVQIEISSSIDSEYTIDHIEIWYY